MTEVRYRPWAPLEGLPDVLYCEALHDDYEHLRILLKGEAPHARTLRILFESAVAYRNINESYRARTWNHLGEALPPLTTVEHSPWIAWLIEESGGVLDEVELTHYAIFTPEDCIDVVSEFAPEVSWLSG